MDFSNLLYDNWKNLSIKEKRVSLKDIIKNFDIDIQLKEIKKFQLNNISLETGIFTIDEDEFVFIPGKEVVLGWEKWETELNEYTKKMINESADMFQIDNIEKYIKSVTSPVRKVFIQPLFVERMPKEIGVEPIPIHDPFINNDPKLKKYLNNFKKDKKTTWLEINNCCRFIKSDNKIVAFKINEISYKNFINKFKNSDFSILIEDEWEYVCGGGSRTLFKWGDSFSKNMKFKHFHNSNDLEKPNMFGLHIAYDPYAWELTSSKIIFKGGDGGCNICGGAGIFFGYLPVSTFYRDPNIHELTDIKTNISTNRYRRIIRI